MLYGLYSKGKHLLQFNLLKCYRKSSEGAHSIRQYNHFVKYIISWNLSEAHQMLVIKETRIRY
jgi:hypothetical protein